MLASSLNCFVRSAFGVGGNGKAPSYGVAVSLRGTRSLTSSSVYFSKEPPSAPNDPSSSSSSPLDSPSSPASNPNPTSSPYSQQSSFFPQRQRLPNQFSSAPTVLFEDDIPPPAAVPDDPRQLYKPAILRKENLVPLSVAPVHPYLLLSERDKAQRNEDRENPLPDFPRPINVPAYPEPILPPSAPLPAGSPPTIRYRDLPPEALAELYRARIMARPKKGKDQGWIQKFYDAFDAEIDDPNGWVLVRDKMGLPPTTADRPASILFWWENLEEDTLWKGVVPLFWVWALVPVLGAASIFGLMVYDGYYEDENGNLLGALGFGGSSRSDSKRVD